MSISSIVKNKWWEIVIFVLAVIKIMLLSGLTLHTNGTSPHDNMLFINYAKSILESNWLGEYNEYTLIKGPVYSLFLALCNLLNLPYLTGLGVLYSLATVYFVLVLKKIFHNKVLLLIIYAFILFSPSMFSVEYTTNVYRNAIIPPFVIFVFASFFSFYLNRFSNNSSYLKSAIASGVALLLFWYVREDSIWILPYVIGVIVVTVISIALNRKKIISFKKKFLISIVPVLVLIIGTNLLCFTNYIYYGLYDTSDYKSSNYAKVVKEIRAIEQDESFPYVWVNHSTIEKLYEVSPTFATIKPQMEAQYTSTWQLWGTGKDDGEIEKDYIFWALRDAVAAAGYYRDAKVTNRFYGEILNEINLAYEQGRLQKAAGINIGVGVSTKNLNISMLIDKCVEGVKWITNYEHITVDNAISSGNINNLRLTESITGNSLIYPKKTYLNVMGWAFALNDNDTLELMFRQKNGNDIELNYLNLQDSSDVYDFFEEQGLVYHNAKESRFYCYEEITDAIQSYLDIYLNNKLINTIELSDGSNSTTSYGDADYKINFENIEKEYFVYPILEIRLSNLEIPKLICELYKFLSPLLTVLGLLCYSLIIIQTAVKCIRKDYSELPILFLLTGLLASFFVVVFGVSLAYVEAWNSSSRYFYMMACYPLIEIFNIVSIGYCIFICYERSKKLLSKRGDSSD